MYRKKLYSALRSAVKANGYNLYSGFPYSLNGTPMLFPAAWLSPPEICRVEGRKEGFFTYSVTLQLMQMAIKMTPELREQKWGEMEGSAMDIISAAGDNTELFNIQNITMSPAEYTLSKHGEISMKVTFEARMHFYRS